MNTKFHDSSISLKYIYSSQKSGPVYLALSSFVINILSLALPIILMQVYDRIIGQKGLNSLLWLAIGGATAILIESALRLLRFHLGSWILAKYEYDESNNIFSSIFSNPHHLLSKYNTGEILESLKFPSRVRNLYSDHIFQVLMDLPFTIIFLAIIFSLNMKIGLFLILLNIIYVGISRLILYFVSKTKEDKLKIESKRVSLLIEIISRIKMLKALGIGESVLRRNEHIQEKHVHNEFNTMTLLSLPQAITIFFSQVNLFGILIIGSISVMNGDMTIGMLTACTILGGRAFRPLVGLFSFWNGNRDLKSGNKKVSDIMRQSSKYSRDNYPEFPTDIEGQILIEGLSFSYNEKKVLNNLNLMIQPKKTTAIKSLDKSGASTLVNIIKGNLTPTAGSVLIDNYDIFQFNNNNINKVISYVNSEDNIYKGTILDNITLFEKHNNDLATDCAGIVGLDELVSELPEGYNTKIDPTTTKILTSDLTIRIAIARALLHRPKILILDKVEQAMDENGLSMFSWLINKLNKKMTIIIITRNEDIIETADLAYEINSGTLNLIQKKD